MLEWKQNAAKKAEKLFLRMQFSLLFLFSWWECDVTAHRKSLNVPPRLCFFGTAGTKADRQQHDYLCICYFTPAKKQGGNKRQIKYFIKTLLGKDTRTCCWQKVMGIIKSRVSTKLTIKFIQLHSERKKEENTKTRRKMPASRNKIVMNYFPLQPRAFGTTSKPRKLAIWFFLLSMWKVLWGRWGSDVMLVLYGCWPFMWIF